jgi:hypothetical protein
MVGVCANPFCHFLQLKDFGFGCMYACPPCIKGNIILAIVYGASLLNQKADDGRGTYEAVEHMGDERLHQFLSC